MIVQSIPRRPAASPEKKTGRREQPTRVTRHGAALLGRLGTVTGLPLRGAVDGLTDAGTASTASRPAETPAARPPVRDRAARDVDDYRYWPVFVAVSIARPDSLPLPLMSVRM